MQWQQTRDCIVGEAGYRAVMRLRGQPVVPSEIEAGAEALREEIRKLIGAQVRRQNKKLREEEAARERRVAVLQARLEAAFREPWPKLP